MIKIKFALFPLLIMIFVTPFVSLSFSQNVTDQNTADQNTADPILQVPLCLMAVRKMIQV